MARVFPNRIGRASKPVALAFRQFKKLPDDFHVWFSLPGIAGGEDSALPHCFLLWRGRFGFLVHIADVEQPLAETLLQATLFQTGEMLTVEELGREEVEILDGFSSGLRAQLDVDLPLCQLVVFPQVNQGTIEAISLQRADSGTHFLGLQKLNSAALPEFLSGIAEADLCEPHLLHLRRSFSPEATVPAGFSPLRLAERNTDAELADGLLDLDQEWCMKNDLYLPEEAEELANSQGLMGRGKNQLVTGVAGSGKSLVLLYRALCNARLNPEARVLVLTHNRPLIFELQRRAGELGGAPANLVCQNFYRWARSELVKIGGWFEEGEIVPPYQVKRELGRMLYKDAAPSGGRTSFTVGFLADEIAWIKDQNIRGKAAYLAAARSGRGTALQASQREEVWRYFGDYQKWLESEKKIDWNGVAMRFLDAAAAGRLGFPSYDCILIDEAQFFAKTWFDVVRLALAPDGQLFLAADPTQGFLRRRQSWLASGIEVRGRTARLRKAYRNSRCVLRFARAFYEGRDEGVDDGGEVEELNIPTLEQIAAIPIEGVPPQIVRCQNRQDVCARVANEIATLHGRGLPTGQVLALTADPKMVEGFTSALAEGVGVHDAKHGPRPTGAFCSFSTINAATGLEAQIVLVFGVEDLFEADAAAGLPDGERSELRRDNTRRLYMAFTRAGQRLVIITHNADIADELETYLNR